MTDVDALVAAILDDPADSGLRLVLADYLDEQDDPRGHLLRLVPSLLRTPRREGLRPDTPAKVWQGPRRLLTTRRDWPNLPCPVPPGRHVTGWRYTYRGLHCLGRLLSIALVRDFLEDWPEVGEVYDHLQPVLTCCELYHCGLLSAQQCDGPWTAIFHDPAAWKRVPFHVPFWRTLSPCRSGSFGAYRSVAIDLLFVRRVDWQDGEDAKYQRRCELKQQVAVYSRCLDLAEAFGRIVPWQAARALYKRRCRASTERWLAREKGVLS